MKKAFLMIFATITLSIFSSNSACALSLNQLPTAKNSDHWKVTFDKPDINDEKLKKDVFNVYSLDIKNIGDKVYDPQIEVYRDEPNTRTMYWLFTSGVSPLKQDFHHQNMPVSSNAKNIEIVITWREQPYEKMTNGEKYSARKYKQTFVFKQK